MEKILFLHGWGASGDIWRATENALKTISPSVFCVFPTFNCNPVSILTLENYVDFIEPDLVNGPPVHIVAHSFGARVAILLANRHPEMVKSIVFTGAAGLKPRFNFMKWIRIRLYKWFKIGWGSEDYRKLTPEGKATFRNIIGRDLYTDVANLGRLGIKTLLIWGKRDRATPIYMARRFKKLLPGAELKVYPHAGHYAFLDEPGQFVTDITEFLGKITPEI